ncbi:MAG: NAD(P)H-dependent oxidoreductase [Asticcacaulis sp.]
MSKPYKILAITGSLRKASFNTALLNTLAETDYDGLKVDVADISEVPLYNQDIDVEPVLPAVKTLRDQVAEADAIIVASPEYNYAMSGVAKNLIDWLSRPYGKAALAGKPVLIITTSPGSTGGVRAQSQLRGTLAAVGAHPLGGAEVVISAIDKKVVDGKFTDEANLAFIAQSLGRLKEEIKVRGA